MSTFLQDNALYVSKKETVSGTAETFTADDYVLMPERAEITDLTVEYTDTSKYVTGDHTHDVVEPKTATITIESDFRARVPKFVATGSSASPAWATVYPLESKLNSAGVGVLSSDPTDVSTEDGTVTLTPQKKYDCSTSTSAMYDEQSCSTGATKGIEYKGKGFSSTLVIEASEPGEPLMLKFSEQGAVESVKDITPVPVIKDADVLITLAPRWVNADVKITEVNLDGSAKTGAVERELCSDSMKLDAGNVLTPIACQKDEFGIKQFIISAKDAMLNILPELESIANYDWWKALNKASVYKIDIVYWGDSARTRKIAEIIVPRAQMISLAKAGDAVKRQDQAFRCLRNTQGASPVEKEETWSLTLYGETDDQTS